MGSVDLKGAFDVPGKYRRIRLFTRQVLWMLENCIVQCPNPECSIVQRYRGGEDGIGICPHCGACYPVNDGDLIIKDRAGNQVTTIPSEEKLDHMGREI